MLLNPGFAEADGVAGLVVFDVLQHDDMVGAGGYGSTGHDFDRLTLRKLHARHLDGVAGPDLADDRERLAGSQIGGMASVAIASGAVERRLIAVSEHRAPEHAAERIRKADNFSLAA